MHQVELVQEMLFSSRTPPGKVDTVSQVCPPSTVLTATPTVLLPTRLYPTDIHELGVAQATASRWVTPVNGLEVAQCAPPSVLSAAISCPGVANPKAPTAMQTSADVQVISSSGTGVVLPLTETVEATAWSPGDEWPAAEDVVWALDEGGADRCTLAQPPATPAQMTAVRISGHLAAFTTRACHWHEVVGSDDGATQP
jgi:hypothetical protein